MSPAHCICQQMIPYARQNMLECLSTMVALVGTCATLGGEPRQARKGAAVAADAGAVVLLTWAALHLNNCLCHSN